MAETATRVLSSTSPSSVKLISPHGDDDFGLLLRTGMQQAGMRTDGLFVPRRQDGERRTAVCSLMLDDAGDLISGVADMDIGRTALHAHTEGAGLLDLLKSESPEVVVFDGNIGSEQAGQLLAACEAYNTHSMDDESARPLLTLFEPTSIAKSTVVLQHFAAARSGGLATQPITFVTPNAVELDQMYKLSTELGLVSASSAAPPGYDSDIPSTILDPVTIANARSLVNAGIFSTILLKVGRHGVITIDAKRVQHHPIPAGPVQVVNTTGCGDSFAGAFTATLCHLVASQSSKSTRQWDRIIDSCVEIGQRAARNTLASTKAVGDGMHLLLQHHV